jgi:hypothetical protein
MDNWKKLSALIPINGGGCIAAWREADAIREAQNRCGWNQKPFPQCKRCGSKAWPEYSAHLEIRMNEATTGTVPPKFNRDALEVKLMRLFGGVHGARLLGDACRAQRRWMGCGSSTL